MKKGSKAVEFEQFRFCTSLEKVVLPAGLERIGIDAFTGCTSLKSLSIPASVAEIGKYPARSCTSLQEITVASGNRHYTSWNGALYTKDMKTLIQYPGGRTGGVVIPQGGGDAKPGFHNLPRHDLHPAPGQSEAHRIRRVLWLRSSDGRVLRRLESAVGPRR